MLFRRLNSPFCPSWPRLAAGQALGMLALAASPALAQTVPGNSSLAVTPPAAPARSPDQQVATHPRDWSLHFQQTIIDHWHGAIRSSYSSPYSLRARESAKLSLTTTVFVGRRLWRPVHVAGLRLHVAF